MPRRRPSAYARACFFVHAFVAPSLGAVRFDVGHARAEALAISGRSPARGGDESLRERAGRLGGCPDFARDAVPR